MKTEILPFTSDMIPEAAVLLAHRHQRNRQILPLLPPRFEQSEQTQPAIESLLAKKTTSGYAAVRGGKMVGYLLGDTSVQPWGRCAWVRLPGSALAPDEPVSTLQDLYVVLGDDWVNRGIFIHHTYQSATNPDIINAWFNLDFGKERIDALVKMDSLPYPALQVPPGIHIRRAEAGDEAALASMSDIIMRELAKAPYWHPTPHEVWPELEEGWAELATDPDVMVWLAEDDEDGRTLATIGFWDEEETAEALLIPPNTFTFSIAATREEARGRGLATALLWTGLAHYRDAGYDTCFTDWISPNLAASRFWPRFGFQEAAYRLTRNINSMIAWTRIS